jgi:hypothetical protein
MALLYITTMKDEPDALEGFFYLFVGLLIMHASSALLGLSVYWIIKGIAALFA